MIDLKTLKLACDAIAAEKGPFTLFALFLRNETPDKWDLVVSSPWLEEGKLKALGELVEALGDKVGDEEILSLSRIVTLNHGDPVLDAVLDVLRREGAPSFLRNRNFGGVETKEAFIITANPQQHFEVGAT